MRSVAILALSAVLLSASELPRGQSGTSARYRLATPIPKPSVISAITLVFEDSWVGLRAVKQDGSRFEVWLLHPEAPERYILREGDAPAREYRNAVTGAAVLPSTIDMARLLPEALAGGAEINYLGHRYLREEVQKEIWKLPEGIRVVALRPDLLVGPASNARPKDDRRRWDGSDYEMVRFTRDDYRQLASAGVNCVRADDAQAAWADELGMFYWGAGQKLPYPEMLYRSQYLGPALYLDEPAVGTRDHVLRPRLAKDASFRKSILPRDALAAFEAYYDDALAHGAPIRLQSLLAARGDVDLGALKLVQENLYSWETMISTAAYQLSRRRSVPEAFVFEPPGRIGSHRTLPELNMTCGTQFSAGDAGALAELIFSFLRGAARLARKDWGVSIYGAVERDDSFLWLSRAYDLGATRFHFWDNSGLACVPAYEYRELARYLANHAASFPTRDLDRLRRAAEVAITLPPGYDLGHTQMGRGNLWGLGELNLERRNDAGVSYRTVMSNFYLEAERCLSQGIPFDSLWELPRVALRGYREVVRVREDGRVEVETAGRKDLLPQARRVARKPGQPPELALEMHGQTAGNAVGVTAVAHVRETTAPVYYTHGADSQGIYHNAMVLWELFGPGEEDYRFLMPEGMRPTVRRRGTEAEVEIAFRVEHPGRYRLRAATVDTDGRRRVVWRTFDVSPGFALRLPPLTAPAGGSERRRAPHAPGAGSGMDRERSLPPDSDRR